MVYPSGLGALPGFFVPMACWISSKVIGESSSALASGGREGSREDVIYSSIICCGGGLLGRLYNEE